MKSVYATDQLVVTLGLDYQTYPTPASIKDEKELRRIFK